ncbi:hypothetical protein SDC9_203958 [bioreactor metagenome]|uniref:Uncharacterized protein n=1 Tax=bioreactor metagenome TaxID=1076179 RepID=A0A645IZH9_9ZZZZ
MGIAHGRRSQNLSGRQSHALQVGFAAAFQQLAQQQPFSTGSRHIAQQLGHAALKCICYLLQHQDGDIARAVFEIGQMALRHHGRRSQSTARETAARTQIAHPLAQGLQQRAFARFIPFRNRRGCHV